MDGLNQLIQTSRDKLLCDSNCQREKQAEQYRQDYSNAIQNEESAPYEVESTRQNYITFTEGTLAYNREQRQRLMEQAQSMSDMYSNNFNNSATQLTNNINMYSSLMANYNNVQELYANYLKQNATLSSTDKKSLINTNKRLTFYENQQIDFLNFIYLYILLIIYVIIVIIYILYWALYPSTYNWKIKLGVFIFLIILPFISTWILSIFIYICYQIYMVFPKNVYFNANNDDPNLDPEIYNKRTNSSTK
jgi:hypothetical protein